MLENKFFAVSEMNLLITAMQFAATKHRDQRRKDREASPYINHPIKVAEILWQIGKVRDVEILVAALLHDIIEDTATTTEEVCMLFGEPVLELVLELTDDKTVSKAARKKIAIEDAPYKSKRAKQVKIADISCNIRDIAYSPPPLWTYKRRRNYFEWCERVVNGSRGCNPALENYFDEVLAMAFRMLEENKENKITFNVNDRVRYPRHPEWGIGKIVDCSDAEDMLRIFFVDAGYKRIPRRKAILSKITTQADSKHPVLDNLKPVKSGRYRQLNWLVENFLTRFAEGFYTEEYEQQRSVLMDARAYLQEVLNQLEFLKLLDNAEYEVLRARVLNALAKTSLLDLQEQQRVQVILANPYANEQFLKSLYYVLFHGSGIQERFTSFISVLYDLGLAEWKFATYFLFLFYPKTNIFLHNQIVPAAAESCAFELEYSELPSWNTYQHLLDYVYYLKNSLEDMRPRDMFDVYAFIVETARTH